uniref:Uncharacterized protein n=1 Tax=Astyanax mexicanus TaxID=7994 RepID=W5LSA1_ASTMX
MDKIKFTPSALTSSRGALHMLQVIMSVVTFIVSAIRSQPSHTYWIYCMVIWGLCPPADPLHHHHRDSAHPQAHPLHVHGLGRLHHRHGHDVVADHLRLRRGLRELLRPHQEPVGSGGDHPGLHHLRPVLHRDIPGQAGLQPVCHLRGSSAGVPEGPGGLRQLHHLRLSDRLQGEAGAVRLHRGLRHPVPHHPRHHRHQHLHQAEELPPLQHRPAGPDLPHRLGAALRPRRRPLARLQLPGQPPSQTLPREQLHLEHPVHRHLLHLPEPALLHPRPRLHLPRTL